MKKNDSRAVVFSSRAPKMQEFCESGREHEYGGSAKGCGNAFGVRDRVLEV